MKNQKRHSRKLLSILLVLCMALTIVPITAFAAGVNYIDKISVTYTKPDYKAGDAPQAAATVTEGECSVAYEYWMEIEQKTEGSVWTSTGRYWYSDSSKMASLAADKQITQFEAGHHYTYNIVLKTNTAVTKDIGANYEIAYESWEDEQHALWYSDEHYYPNELFLDRFTSFEEGKSYRYSILLKAKNGRTFAATDSGLTVTVNGWTVEQQNISMNLDGQSVYVTGIATITPTKPVEPKEIEVIEINNATITFKDGDKPVFTGNVPDNKDYAFRCEWWSLDSDTGLVSTEPEWGSGIYKNKITTFEAGKTYHYGVYVTAYYGNFSPDAKLKINGQYVNYKRIGDDDNMQTMWLETDLTMTPFDSSHTHSYGADWKSDSDNHWHECSCGSIADKAAHDMETKNAKDATATEKGYTGDKVCKVCGYTVKGKEIPVSGTTKPTNPTKPDGNTDVTSPKTGDNSNLWLWFAVLFLSAGMLIGTSAYSKKKKYSK